MSAPLPGPDLRRTVDAVTELRAHGYDDMWTAEVGSFDSYVVAGAVAATQRQLRIGTAIVPAQTRSPMVHAMAAAALSDLTGGNFTLGLGISSSNIISGWAGLPFDRQVLRMREHVEALRAILAGEKVTYEGETIRIDRFRLETGPPAHVPIYMAALNPQMLRLAGRVADGVILNMAAEDKLPIILGEVRSGCERAGRDPAELGVVARIHIVVTDDVEAGREFVRRAFGAYAATSAYNSYFDWIGFSAQAEAVAAGFAAGDRAATASAIDDEMCDAMAVVGTIDDIGKRLRRYAEAGVDVAALNPLDPTTAVRTMIDLSRGDWRPPSSSDLFE